ncbi:hypothetical protein ACFYNW_35900 [Streptomyces virginiae]|uniref:hypothetical protein n=1 Tax=Streptomyces virginiae TaxID=1961 RepID=UPI0033A95456
MPRIALDLPMIILRAEAEAVRTGQRADMEINPVYVRSVTMDAFGFSRRPGPDGKSGSGVRNVPGCRMP